MVEVMVAMSGGVDSSVAAALMVEAGHSVTGVTLKLRTGPSGEAPTQGCCTAADALDARRVADALRIPYYVFDVSEGFDRSVVQPFVESYLSGRTPNPCVECNRHVKFSLLLGRAQALGMDLLVTGHHARLRVGPDGRRHLLRAVDGPKDQSYVLHMLGQRELSRSAFPVGELTKARVREMAVELGLRTAAKPESQDACFLGPGGVAALLKREAGARLRPGAVVDEAGRVVGRHDGSVFTIGQRRGVGVAAGRRVYVTEIRAAEATVVVGDEDRLWRRRLRLGDVSWVSGRPPRGRVDVQVRAHGATAPGLIENDEVRLEEPLRAPAPGQSAVFYQGEEMLGGGVIAQALS